MGKPRDQSFAKARLKFIKARSIDQSGNHFANVIGLAQIIWHHPQQFGGIIGGIFWCCPVVHIERGTVQV